MEEQEVANKEEDDVQKTDTQAKATESKEG